MDEETNVNASGAAEQIVIDFGDICRFCLAETNSNISIHARYYSEDSFEMDDDTISDFVAKITSIEMDNSDAFPSLICENCFGIVNMCFEFRQSCRQSYFALRDCYRKTLEEAKAKFSFTNLSCESDASLKLEPPEVLEIKSEEAGIKVENDGDENYDGIAKEGCESLESRWRKGGLTRKDSPSVLKAGTIKQKYQRMNSLSERLKEAQSKLIEDILRTKEIISSSMMSEGMARFSCPRCAVSFVSSEMLAYHFITSHASDGKAQTTLHAFRCKMCKKEFRYMHQLMRHYKNMHKIPVSRLAPEYVTPKSGKSARSTYRCVDCLPPKVFSRRKMYLRHVSEHAKVDDGLRGGVTGKLYACTRCDSPCQTFATKFSLNRHLMNIHKMNRAEISDAKPEANDSETATALNLVKIHVCVDCSPPASFPDVSAFVEHKSAVHERRLESMSLKELTPVYVESVNVFQSDRDHERRQTFRVICKSCATPSEHNSASDFVRHTKLHHVDVPKESWDVETKFRVERFPAASAAATATNAGDRVWKCTECPASYMRKHSLRHHLKEKHDKVLGVGGVECPEAECAASFFTNRQVIHHGITVHGKYFANLHKVFKDRILLDAADADDRVRNFECDICQKKYLGKTSLKRHILKCHLGKGDAESAVCPYCGKTFSNNLNLKSHIEFVHEALFVSCPVCKKSINFKTIGKHYKIHQASEFDSASKSRYLCNQCGRVLKSKSGFDDHQKLHLNVRDQICDVCGNGFTTKKNLYIHKKAHDATRRKVFECDKCDKVFTGKHTLNRHLLTHSGEKNFICEICSKCFYTLQELNRHVRYHNKEYRFDCQLCDMRFLDRSRFRHHMMRHRNVRPHKCHFCDKVFIVRRKMNLHMAARHNVHVQNTKAVWKDPKTYVPLDDLL